MAKVISVLTIATLALGLVATLGTMYQHRLNEAVERDRDREHIRQLEKIITQEFPKYTWAIDWDDK